MNIGIIGSGSFGRAIAQLVSENAQSLRLYARRPEVLQAIDQRQGEFRDLAPQVQACDNLQELAENCDLIFPMIPSQHFRSMMRDLSPFLQPYHILIHGTKGFDTSLAPKDKPLSLSEIRSMSQVIMEESIVCRVGCLSGPNLAAELLAGLPAATLIASRFREVIKIGQKALRSSRFQVYGIEDITGAELAGALKNIIALAAGIVGGRKLGTNLWALLITRGLAEMIHLGKAMGAEVKAFLGVAGIGDLVATASSTRSRNYRVGERFAQGESLQAILDSMNEVAEGLRTLETVKALADELQLSLPIIEILYRVFFKNMDLDRAIHFLTSYAYEVDVDFLDTKNLSPR